MEARAASFHFALASYLVKTDSRHRRQGFRVLHECVPDEGAALVLRHQHHDAQINPCLLYTSRSLSLKQAEALALKNNPQISVARLTALASHQVTREVRSSLWPTATGDLTGVDSKENSRITAGGLNNPIIYERAAAGVTVSQLITDFGLSLIHI